MEVLRPLSASECEICSQEYSDTVIPRILTQCGHTVCEVCAGNLLDDENSKITCPICRQETVVNGTVESLPKNFTVLQMARGNEEA